MQIERRLNVVVIGQSSRSSSKSGGKTTVSIGGGYGGAAPLSAPPLITGPLSNPTFSSSPRADGCVKLLVKPKVLCVLRGSDVKVWVQMPSMPQLPARPTQQTQPVQPQMLAQVTPRPADDTSKAILAQVCTDLIAHLHLSADYEVAVVSYLGSVCVSDLDVP